MQSESSLKDEQVADSQERASGSPVRAMTLGLVVFFIGSFVVGAGGGLIFAIYSTSNGASSENLNKSLQLLSQWSLAGVLLMVVGGLLSMLGGYVCARVSKKNEYKLGAILAVICTSGTFLVQGHGGDALISALNLLSTFVGVLLGSHIGFTVRQKKASTLSTS